MKILKVLPLLLLLLCRCPARGAAHARGQAQGHGTAQYEHYSHLRSAELLRMGEEFLYGKEMPDSAFLCYTIAAERYRPDMKQAETALCLEGYYGRWMSRLINYSDIPAAMQDLAAAQEIIERTSLPRHKLDLYYGQCYMSMHLASGFKPHSMSAAVEYFNRSARTALGVRDYRTFHSAFNNLVTSALLCDSAQMLSPLVRTLRSLREPDMTQRNVSLLWYEGATAMHSGRYPQAIAAYDSMVRILPADFRNARLRAGALLHTAVAHLSLGHTGLCEAMADSMAALSMRFRLPDIRMTAYMLRSNAAESRGLPELARDYRMRYLELKDSLAGERQAADFQEIASATRRRAMQRDIDAAEYSSRLRGNTLIFTCVTAALLLGFVVYLIRSNRRIRRRSEMLYRQLQSALNSPEWIDTATEISEPATQAHDEEAEPDGNTEEKEEGPNTITPQDNPPEKGTEKSAGKYLGSGLSDESSARLAARIREFMLNSEEIYSPDFSMASLAAGLDTNRQYLSQCVNQQFGCNFATLVNRARIRRAMLMLDDEANYGHYSIEGIAESVGFRTRSSFTSWFRRFTGLSAAEYRRLGKSLRPKL